MNIFTKAWNNENLTPGERAFLKLAQTLLWTALIAAVLAGTQYLDGAASVDWGVLARTVGVGAGIAVLNALNKYFTAQTDVPIGQTTVNGTGLNMALGLATSAIQKKLDALSTTIQQQASSQPAQQGPLVVVHNAAPAAPENVVSPPTATPAVTDTTSTAVLPTLATAPISTSVASDPFKAPEQVAQVPFSAQLANSFAFSSNPATTPAVVQTSTGTAHPDDTMPKSAVAGK